MVFQVPRSDHRNYLMARGTVDRSTFIGQIASVRGGTIMVRLNEMARSLVMVGGQTFRVGQIGAFLRVPLGYTQLYGVCTQVGADAAPQPTNLEGITVLEVDERTELTGYRWLTLVLFG